MDHDEHPGGERLQAFLEGDLPFGEQRRVEEHVGRCARCSAELDSWRVLFDDLAALPSHRPHRGHPDDRTAFADRVMAAVRVPERPERTRRLPLAARLGQRLASLVPRGRPAHPGHEALQDLLEGLLPARRARAVEAHVGRCAACSTELGAWRSVLGRLSELERFGPREGFDDRVMAAVRSRLRAASTVPDPTWRRALALTLALSGRFVPRTRRAWAAVSGVAFTPAVVVGLVVYTVFSHPTLTPGALLSYGLWQVTDLLAAAWSAALQAGLEGAGSLGIGSLLQTLAAAPMMVAGGLLAYSAVFAVAVRVLYQNLAGRSPSRPLTRSLNGRYARASTS